uniref:Uncharacterized protein n=1 Tax=Arundo donax TaxID=35708 RepID=A0A0A9BHJ5_ARUDO
MAECRKVETWMEPWWSHMPEDILHGMQWRKKGLGTVVRALVEAIMAMAGTKLLPAAFWLWFMTRPRLRKAPSAARRLLLKLLHALTMRRFH